MQVFPLREMLLYQVPTTPNESVNKHITYNVFNDLGTKVVFNKFSIYFPQGYHEQIQISGSNDGTNWDGLGEEDQSTQQSRTFEFNNTVAYKQYRLIFKPNLYYGLGMTPTMHIGELSFFGYPENIAGVNIFATASHALSASYAPDNLWHEGIGYISSSNSTNVFVSGNLEIQGNKIITLDGSNTFQNDNGILNIGNVNSQYRQISFQIETDTPLVLKNHTNGNFVGIGTTTPTKPLTVFGDISASGDLLVRGLTIDTDNGYAPVVWNSSTGQFHTTSSTAFGGDVGDVITNNITNIENTLWSTSSVDGSITSSLNTNVRISGSLSVQSHLEIFENPSIKNYISIGTTDTSKTLNVSGSVLISNVKDANDPDSEGILMESYGNNNATINNIFLKQTSNGKYGTQLFLNGSTTYDTVTQTLPGAFGIINHNNSTFGTPIITVLQDGKLGLQKVSPTYDIHVGKFTFFDKNVAIASNQSMSVGAGTKPPTALTVEGDISASGNLYLNGTANIQGFTFENTTALVTSASTIFGNQQSDTHQFTGSVFLNNDLTVNGELYGTSSWAINTLTASYIKGFTDDDWFVDGSKRLTSSRHIFVSGNITSSGHISASGNLFADLPGDISINNLVFYNTSSGQLVQSKLSDLNIIDSSSLSVSNINVPFSSSNGMIKVQQDLGDQSTSSPGSSTENDVTPTSASLVDGSETNPEYFKIYPFNEGTDQTAANIIFNFFTPVIVSEFRHKFFYNSGHYYLPKELHIYGKNTPFTGGIDEGTLLAEGVRPSNAAEYDQSNPTYLTGGELSTSPSNIEHNTKRTSSISETSLTSSFQYYRIRYSGSFGLVEGKEKGVILNEITPVTRSFTQGTSVSFNNGIITGDQVITNNLIGTSSYAIYAENSTTSDNGFPYIGDASITGSLSVSGNINFSSLTLNGNLDLNNYSIQNVANLDVANLDVGNLNSNNITSTTLNTNILNIGTLPSQSIQNNSGISTTGPIIVTSIITGSATESYNALSTLKVNRRGPDISLPSNYLGSTLELTSSNYIFTSGSSASLVDGNLATSIIVNQNTLGTTTVFNPEGPYPSYGVPDNGLSSPTITNFIQTESFYVQLKFPEPVLLEEFRINFAGNGITYNYSETSMSLEGNNVFDNDTESASISKQSESLFQESSDLGILVDDSDSAFQTDLSIDLEVFNNLSSFDPYHRFITYLMDPSNNDIIIGYDFGVGNETIISRYSLYLYKNHNATSFVFEGSNNDSDWILLDGAGDNAVGTEFYSAINNTANQVPFNESTSVNPIHHRDQNDFQNITAFRYYRFRFLTYLEPHNFSIFKFEFYKTTTSSGGGSDYNPKYISIYSDNEGNNFNFFPGTFNNTTIVTDSDISKTASLATFNSENGNPLSQYYTIEFSGSHNLNNLVGISEIQPITRSFTTQSLTFGPDIVYPDLSPTPPSDFNCSSSNVVYYNSESGTFFYTSSCGGDTNTNTNNTFDTILTNILKEKDTGKGITLSSSIKIVPSNLPTHSFDDAKSFGVIAFDTSSGELKSIQERVVITDDDGDVDLNDGTITSHGGTFGNVQIIEDEIKPKPGSKLDIKADTIKPPSGSKLTLKPNKILPPEGERLTLGDEHAPIDGMHIKRGTIYFYSSSDAYSSSLEVAQMTINTSSNEVEFKSGSGFNKIRASEINLGSGDSFNGQGSVQIGQSTQGFIAVNAEPGKFSTVLRAESTAVSGDFRMGSITQKGSGSFAILLDADQIRPDAKFGVYSNTAVPGLTTPLITVSESFETRIHNGGLKADNYVTTTNITASGTISSSGNIVANSITSSNFVLRSQKSILAENLAGVISKTIVTNLADSGLIFGDTSISTTLQGSNISTQVGSPINLNGNVTSSGNISGSHTTTASFGSLQLSNLPTTPTGLPTGSVWVSGSKNDTSTDNVNSGTLMIVI